MNFQDAVRNGFKKYANFNDRAPRSEYWYWSLFVVLVTLAAMAVERALHLGAMAPLSNLVTLALLVPGFAQMARRLHDLDKSGWWMLIGLIPFVGAIILLVWFCSKGTVGPNRFGADPLQAYTVEFTDVSGS